MNVELEEHVVFGAAFGIGVLAIIEEMLLFAPFLISEIFSNTLSNQLLPYVLLFVLVNVVVNVIVAFLLSETFSFGFIFGDALAALMLSLAIWPVDLFAVIGMIVGIIAAVGTAIIRQRE